jgi:hypothetical protein
MASKTACLPQIHARWWLPINFDFRGRRDAGINFSSGIQFGRLISSCETAIDETSLTGKKYWELETDAFRRRPILAE